MHVAPVRKIRQACVLACLESFFLDNGIANRSQPDLINLLKPSGLCNDEGIIWDFEKVALQLGLNCTQLNSCLPAGAGLGNDEALLFFLEGIQGNGRHCIRFVRDIPPDGIEAMDPESGHIESFGYGRLTSGLMVNSQFNIFKISVPGK